MSASEAEYLKAEEVYMQLNQSEVMESDVVEEQEDHWDHKSIKEMLTLYLRNVDKFRSPKVKKKRLWVEIAEEIGKGPDSCDKKFRNLKQTYIRLLKKRNRNEIVVSKWPYFEIFEQIYNTDGEYQQKIQEQIQEGTNDTVAKALLSITEPAYETETTEIGDTNVGQSEESKRKLNKRRYTDFRKVTLEMRNRQRVVEEKLDRLIDIVQESNNIQRDRNKLFQQFLDSLHQNNS